MELSNDIILRPRFTMTLSQSPEIVLLDFENAGTSTKNFVISRLDDHVFIRIPKHKQHFWSPQLHLEIYQIENQPTVLKGLYGPSPKVWTLFMFLHFVVGILFIASGVWLYTNIALGASFIIPLITLLVLFVTWFALYFSGRLGKDAGKNEMKTLQAFMISVLQDE